jgi:hypothetical protein
MRKNLRGSTGPASSRRSAFLRPRRSGPARWCGCARRSRLALRGRPRAVRDPRVLGQGRRRASRSPLPPLGPGSPEVGRQRRARGDLRPADGADRGRADGVRSGRGPLHRSRRRHPASPDPAPGRRRPRRPLRRDRLRPRGRPLTGGPGRRGRDADGDCDLFDGLHESISSSALGFSGIPMMLGSLRSPPLPGGSQPGGGAALPSGSSAWTGSPRPGH